MHPLLILPLCLLQDPQPAPVPAPVPVAVQALDPRTLYGDWAKRLEGAKVLHLVANGLLVSTDEKDPQRSVRWTFRTEVWMAKGGRVQARTRWTGPRPEVGEPESFTSLLFANGKRSWQGIEGPLPLQESALSSPRCVPYPLPEIFGLFDPAPETKLPAAAVGETFDWGEPVRHMPTVVVLDPKDPQGEPAFWYGFAERELGGWCTMLPERLGGDVLRAKFEKLDWLERLPEQDPPRFEPAAHDAPEIK